MVVVQVVVVVVVSVYSFTLNYAHIVDTSVNNSADSGETRLKGRDILLSFIICVLDVTVAATRRRVRLCRKAKRIGTIM